MFSRMNFKIDILKEIDVSDKLWCNEAVLISIKNGKGALTHAFGEEDADYQYNEHLLLNGIPILQAKYPICPTCSGLLATGYGIENIDCTELKEIREKINQNFINIKTSANILKPLFGLLDDGFYLLADVPHYPTDGQGNYFHSIPNKLTDSLCTCDSYYIHEFLTAIDGFPAFLYPTQSANCYNPERIDYYIQRFKNDNSLPRAIAYYEKGFVSALLDGHHKAYAAAILGKKVNCLTIMRLDGYRYALPYNKENPVISNVSFSTIQVKFDKNLFENDIRKSEKDHDVVNIQEYNLTDGRFKDIDKIIKGVYPSIEHLTNLYALEIEKEEFNDDMISEWLKNPSYENSVRLEYALNYYMKNDKKLAKKLGLTIVRNNSENTPIMTAYQILTQFNDEETEKVFIDYIVNNDNRSKYYNVVNSYWDDKA